MTLLTPVAPSTPVTEPAPILVKNEEQTASYGATFESESMQDVAESIEPKHEITIVHSANGVELEADQSVR